MTPADRAPTKTLPAPSVQTPATAASELAEVPGYELLGVLGPGGMGVVYKARHLKLRRVVALEMILAGGHAGEADLERFRTEAEAVARLQHPNVVQVFEVGEHGGLPFCCLEFCPGGSLEGKLNGTPLPANEVAAVVEELARGMQAAHAKGVIHRDLKPANVLFAEDGTLKVTDFGLALLRAGVFSLATADPPGAHGQGQVRGVQPGWETCIWLGWSRQSPGVGHRR
jgi:eukaryotic-like serine/threonine-protein kinase